MRRLTRASEVGEGAIDTLGLVPVAGTSYALIVCCQQTRVLALAAKKNPRTKKRKTARTGNATPPPVVLEEPKEPMLFANHERILNRYPELRRIFLKHLARYGNIAAACAYIKVSPYTLDLYKQANPWFAEQMETAKEAHTALIEKTIHERAIDGWLEPKFGKFGVTGYVRKFSDQLLIAYARRHVPEYRQGEANVTTVQGTVDHVHSVKAAELAPEQRQALRLLLGTGDDDGMTPGAAKKITVEPATPSANGHAPSTNGVHKNGTNGTH